MVGPSPTFFLDLRPAAITPQTNKPPLPLEVIPTNSCISSAAAHAFSACRSPLRHGSIPHAALEARRALPGLPSIFTLTPGTISRRVERRAAWQMRWWYLATSCCLSFPAPSTWRQKATSVRELAEDQTSRSRAPWRSLALSLALLLLLSARSLSQAKESRFSHLSPLRAYENRGEWRGMARLGSRDFAAPEAPRLRCVGDHDDDDRMDERNMSLSHVFAAEATHSSRWARGRYPRDISGKALAGNEVAT